MDNLGFENLAKFGGAPTPASADEVPDIKLYAPEYSEERASTRREKFMTKKHTIQEKMQLYTCSTRGAVDELQKLLKEENFSPTEEVSKEGHFWTVLHYASHYGHVPVLKFLVQHLQELPDSYEILNMQTLEGKTPLFCAILSCDIKI